MVTVVDTDAVVVATGAMMDVGMRVLGHAAAAVLEIVVAPIVTLVAVVVVDVPVDVMTHRVKQLIVIIRVKTIVTAIVLTKVVLMPAGPLVLVPPMQVEL